MENIDEKLQTYRLRRRRRERLQRFKDGFRKLIMFGSDNVSSTKEEINQTYVAPTITDDTSEISIESLDDEDTFSNDEAANTEDVKTTVGDSILRYTLWVVYFAFWVTLYIIAIELQFGIVFLMLSALVAIYFNTRTGPKKSNEISAYSVFNKNCESIDGTLKAEQFEREMGIR